MEIVNVQVTNKTEYSRTRAGKRWEAGKSIADVTTDQLKELQADTFFDVRVIGDVKAVDVLALYGGGYELAKELMKDLKLPEYEAKLVLDGFTDAIRGISPTRPTAGGLAKLRGIKNPAGAPATPAQPWAPAKK